MLYIEISQYQNVIQYKHSMLDTNNTVFEYIDHNLSNLLLTTDCNIESIPCNYL